MPPLWSPFITALLRCRAYYDANTTTMIPSYVHTKPKQCMQKSSAALWLSIIVFIYTGYEVKKYVCVVIRTSAHSCRLFIFAYPSYCVANAPIFTGFLLDMDTIRCYYKPPEHHREMPRWWLSGLNYEYPSIYYLTFRPRRGLQLFSCCSGDSGNEADQRLLRFPFFGQPAMHVGEQYWFGN